MFISNAFHLAAISLPIFPSPMIPIVLPFNPRHYENFAFAHYPFLIKLKLSSNFLSIAIIRPITNSATAALFFPGQFQTYIHFYDAYCTSMLSNPEPALIINYTFLLASITSFGTFFDLTIKIFGLYSATFFLN